jgi:5-methylthioadenosine/S-adenosylhomocysteine deaminase
VILRDALVLTMDAERNAYADGFVRFEGDRITAVGPARDAPQPDDGEEVRSLGGHVVMPGLVNGHAHLSNALARGVYDELPLEVWMAGGMWNVMRAYDFERARAGAELALLESMLQGTTTYAVGEFARPDDEWPDGVLAAVERAGARAVLSRMAVDSPDESDLSQAVPPEFRESPDRAAAEVRRLRARWNSDRIDVVPEALGVLRCTEGMVRTLHELSLELGCQFFMHLASSPEELAESHRRFGHGPAAEAARLGILGPRSLFAHMIWLDDDEIRALADAGAGVSHNPVANASYAIGLARLPDLLHAGVHVSLGTDGASTNNSQNLWETAKMAMFFQKNAREDANFGSAELALELLTIGGARALHVEDRIGSLEAGKLADLIVIDVERPALVPRRTLVSSLVYSNDPYAVRSVFVGGVERVRDGRHLALDAGEVGEAATRAAEQLLEVSGLGAHVATRSSWHWVS